MIRGGLRKARFGKGGCHRSPLKREALDANADDDPLVGIGTSAMPEDLGHQAIEAVCGADALRLLETDPGIDLVITDQSMPGMTGLQLAKRIRELKPNLPVILGSGYTDLQGLQTLDVARLPKPLRQDHLEAALLSALRTKI